MITNKNVHLRYEDLDNKYAKTAEISTMKYHLFSINDFIMAKFICSLLFCLTVVLSACGANRAMIVGIGDYDTDRTGWGKIHGDKDVDILVEGLLKNGYARKDIIVLKNQQATKSAIVDGLKRLATLCKNGDQVFFHFSGHGQPVSDLNGDESKDFDESIIPYDAYRSPRYKVGNKYYQAENHLIDDELNQLFKNIIGKIGKRGTLFVSIDACFSQGLEMDDETNLSYEETLLAGSVRGTSQKFRISRNRYLENLPMPNNFTGSGKLVVVSACKSNERNFEYHVPNTNLTYGSLSYYIAELLKTNANFSRWEKCFNEKKYKACKFFVSIQHPTIKVYK